MQAARDKTAAAAFLNWLAPLQDAARAQRHRYLVVLGGARPWSRVLMQALLREAPQLPTLWVGEAAPLPATEHAVELVAVSEAVRCIGQETDRLIYDAWAGLDVDAFAAVTGTLRAGAARGGLMFLLCPPLADWPAWEDPEYARITVAPYGAADVGRRFVRRLCTRLGEDRRVVLVQEGDPLPPLPAPEPADTSAKRHEADVTDLAPCCTADQQRAVTAVMKVIRGQRRRPTVLVADRGRGKSAALGIAAAQLLRDGLDDVVVTGPSLDAVQAVFTHAAAGLPGAERRRQALHWQDCSLRFVAPDIFLREQVRTGLLLVDEAAAIPTHILVDLLAVSPRVAFATTVHGYEGSGRGFALRFRHALDSMTRGWREVRLEAPVRWAVDDPLERFIFDTLLLAAEPCGDPQLDDFDPAACRIERLDRDALVADETTLRSLFGLLISAHYRTRPDDLRYLLDGPNISVIVAQYCDKVVGTALLAEEGGFSAEDARRISQGDIRPHGHLLPETLSVHLGLEMAAMLRGYRIVRIAVHHRLRRRGVAARILEHVHRQAVDAGMDFLGASFGATPELVRFWNACGYSNVRASLRRGGTTALHSALVLAPVSSTGNALVQAARTRFLDLFPHQLCDVLAHLEAPLVHALLQGSVAPLALTATDHEMLKTYIAGQRLYDVSVAAIWRLACHALTRPEIQVLGTEQAWQVLITRVLQKRDWQEISKRHGLAGRRAVDTLLRELIGAIYAEYWRRNLISQAPEIE